MDTSRVREARARRRVGTKPGLVGSLSKPRVLLTGEQILVLEGLRHCLDSELHLDARVIEVARLGEALCLRPAVAVVHCPQSGIDGFEHLRRFRQLAPGVPVVVLAGDEDERLAATAFCLDIHGWVVKSSTVPDFVMAVRSALAGRRYLTPLVADGDIAALPAVTRLWSPRPQLKPRQREVLRLLAKGMIMKDIAAELGITTRTVAFHKYRMMETLRVRSSAELLQFAAKEELAGRRSAS